jgi:hypothetical protein
MSPFGRFPACHGATSRPASCRVLLARGDLIGGLVVAARLLIAMRRASVGDPRLVSRGSFDRTPTRGCGHRALHSDDVRFIARLGSAKRGRVRRSESGGGRRSRSTQRRRLRVVVVLLRGVGEFGDRAAPAALEDRSRRACGRLGSHLSDGHATATAAQSRRAWRAWLRTRRGWRRVVRPTGGR